MIKNYIIKISSIDYNLRVSEVFNHDGELVNIFSSKDILKILNYKENTNINNLCLNVVLISYNELIFEGYKNPNIKGEYFIPTNELLILITRSTKLIAEKKKILLNQLYDYNLIDNKEYIPIVSSRPEIRFLDILGHIFNYFEIEYIKQYNVGNYYVDCYVKTFNVCIEYDESTHKYYDQEKDVERRIFIERKLNCKFIRVSDKYSDGENIEFVLEQLGKLES